MGFPFLSSMYLLSKLMERYITSSSAPVAETVAGIGSMIACNPDEFVVGQQVSGNHISSAHEGDTVRAVATIVHKGRSSHVWNVDVFTSTGKLVSSVRVMNSVLKRR